MNTSAPTSAKSAHSRSRPKPDRLQVKVYVILRRVFRADPKQANVEVLDVKLNLGAAERVRDAYAGTWVERVMADKASTVSHKSKD